jgi:hypothetical protein
MSGIFTSHTQKDSLVLLLLQMLALVLVLLSITKELTFFIDTRRSRYWYMGPVIGTKGVSLSAHVQINFVWIVNHRGGLVIGACSVPRS